MAPATVLSRTMPHRHSFVLAMWPLSVQRGGRSHLMIMSRSSASPLSVEGSPQAAAQASNFAERPTRQRLSTWARRRSCRLGVPLRGEWDDGRLILWCSRRCNQLKADRVVPKTGAQDSLQDTTPALSLFFSSSEPDTWETTPGLYWTRHTRRILQQKTLEGNTTPQSCAEARSCRRQKEKSLLPIAAWISNFDVLFGMEVWI